MPPNSAHSRVTFNRCHRLFCRTCRLTVNVFAYLLSFSFPLVEAALHDDLPGVDGGRLSEAGEAGAETDHADAPPVPDTHGGRLLFTRQEHDLEGEINLQ